MTHLPSWVRVQLSGDTVSQAVSHAIAGENLFKNAFVRLDNRQKLRMSRYGDKQLVIGYVDRDWLKGQDVEVRPASEGLARGFMLNNPAFRNAVMLYLFEGHEAQEPPIYHPGVFNE